MLLFTGIEDVEGTGADLLSTGVLFAEEYAGGPDAGAEADADPFGAEAEEEYAGGPDAGADADADSFGAEAEEDLPPPPAPPLPAHLPPDDNFTSWQSFWFSTGLV
jgi:hypothetical protein